MSSNLTPGAMLAKMLSGDNSVTKADFRKATVDYFAANGCHCTMGEDAPADTKDGEQLRTTALCQNAQSSTSA